jgi:hypothetical protein
MKNRFNISGSVSLSLVASAFLFACGAGTDKPYAGNLDADDPVASDESFASETVSAEESAAAAAEALELGELEAGLAAACGGDDSNMLAAGLAVAIGKELGRWNVSTDFAVSGGKLELSATGKLVCGSGCPKVTALLRLQDDASSTVPNHIPATYRGKLTSWYDQQKVALTNLVTTMLIKDQGVYRIRSSLSSKYIVPQNGSTTNGAILEQSDQYSSTTAAQWRVKLNGTRQQLINIKSGLCMDLLSDTANSTNIVQRSCTGGTTQDFRLGQLDAGILTLRSRHNKAFMPQGNSTANGADIVQNTVTGATAEKFVFEKVGSGHRDLLETVTAAYSLKVAHTGMGLAVSSSSTNDGVSVVQQPYSATDDRFHWYVTQLGTTTINGVVQTTYQFMNRRTGKCLHTEGGRLVQRTCSTGNEQRFTLAPTGNYRQVAYTHNGKTIDVQGGSTASGAPLVEGSGIGWEMYNMITFEPLLAIEPHRLAYSHSTPNGPCGNYDWYKIDKPNGQALGDPSSTFVQLIFAGGKTTKQGTDVNPYIAQQVSGNQVAIDPTYGLTEGAATSSGSCAAACVSIRSSNIAGSCCSCLGKTATFKKAAWNAATFLCQ